MGSDASSAIRVRVKLGLRQSRGHNYRVPWAGAVNSALVAVRPLRQAGVQLTWPRATRVEPLNAEISHITWLKLNNEADST